MPKVFIRKFTIDSGYVSNGDGTFNWIGYGIDLNTIESIEIKGSPKAIDNVVNALIADGFQLEAV
jgi:hypothetical protein